MSYINLNNNKAPDVGVFLVIFYNNIILNTFIWILNQWEWSYTKSFFNAYIYCFNR